MDPYVLLNTNLPFDENKLQILDQVVNVFYKTSNSTERQAADKIMNEFKMLADSWMYCDMILNKSQSLYTKVFALIILEDLIKSKWNLLNNDQKLGIRNFLVDLLIKNVTDDTLYANNQAFINKLNLNIVLIATQEWTTTWTNFISEICSSSKTNQNLCENNLKLLSMLKYNYLYFSDEINKFWKNSMTTHKSLELKTVFSKDFAQIFDLCCFIFDNSSQVKIPLLKNAVRLFSDYVEWFPLEYAFKESVLTKLLKEIIQMSKLRLDVIKCFTSIFSLKIDRMKMDNNQFYQIKQITLQIFKSFVHQMNIITKQANLGDEYKRINMEQLMNFEEFCLQFLLSLIAFFKTNMNFIEEFDFIQGTGQPSEFLISYINEIELGLTYICQINNIPNEEIFRACAEFWNWFCFKICFLKEKNIDPEAISFSLLKDTTMNDYIAYTSQLFMYQNLYFKVLEKVRQILISKMTKPVEVKISVDEGGEIVVEGIMNTTFQTLYETLKECLIYLTHLDPISTNNFMLESLQLQTSEQNWNPILLNSICWSIGSIAGAMEESHEKKFLVMVIKYLLNLCENKKGKDNKAIVAANIMYVVGQYPRFLNSHWKFLKTVVKKLFEFMHEFHPGVQDFACETFLKISIKCGEQFVIKNEGETEPYILTLVSNIYDDSKDLAPHQKLMFYEAIGNMVSKDQDFNKQRIYVQKMMNSVYDEWMKIFEEANKNPEVLLNVVNIRNIDLILKINDRVAFSAGTSYFSFGSYIYDNIIKMYSYYSNMINQAYQSNNQFNPTVKIIKITKKTILKFLQTLVKYNEDKDIILNYILPPLSGLIDQYRTSHFENRDPDVLLVFSEILSKLKNAQYEYINSIWNFLCLFTLEMIKSDFQSFPEHRMNFFTLIKALIFNAFDALFQIQDSNFNKNVLNAIIWAFKHDQPTISETGLETLLILINNINSVKVSNGINVADPFYKSYYFDLIQEIFFVLTDSFHKSGFKLQVEILQTLILVVEGNLVKENLFQEGISNKNTIINYINEMLCNAFSHLNKIQIETFVIALFNKCYNKENFKVVIRDFLVNLKSFADSKDSLYEEERKNEIDLSKIMEEEKKRNLVPGMNPIYDSSIQQKISSINYQNLTK